MNGPTFLSWVQYFVEKVRPTKEKKAILLLDNLEAHKYYPALQFASENNVVFVSFAPHTTHKMQPLDVAVFGPLKVFFEQELNAFQKRYAGRIVNQNDICKIFSPAYLKAATIPSAVKGFKKPGLWPLNDAAFSEDDFLPATVTSRPAEDTQDTPNSDGPTAVEASVNTIVTENMHIQVTATGTSNSDGASCSPLALATFPKPGTSASSDQHQIHLGLELEDGESPCQRKATSKPCGSSPFDIRPLPSRNNEGTTRKRRKCQKAEVLTSTPIKLDQKKKFDDQEKKKKRLFQDNLEQKGRSRPKLPKQKTPVTSNNIQNNNEDTTENCVCFVCGRKYGEPPFDDWIKCGDCNDWVHEGCSDYSGVGSYFCDLCHNL